MEKSKPETKEKSQTKNKKQAQKDSQHTPIATESSVPDDNPEKETTENQVTDHDKARASKKINPIKLRQNGSIPNDYGERIEFIKKIFENEDFPFFYNNAPLKETSTCQEVAHYFALKNQFMFDFIGYLLYYLSTTFTVDTSSISNKKAPSQSAEDVFKAGTGMSLGLCNLYKEMCAMGGIKIEIISGMLKKHGYKNGDSLFKHHWCALNIGKLYFIDPMLAMGDITNENVFERRLKLFYFLTPPEFMIDTHRPDWDKWQWLNKSISVKQFSVKPLFDYELFYSKIYKYNIRLITNPSPEFTCKDEELIFKIGIDNASLTMKLELINGKKIAQDNYSIEYNDKKKYFLGKVLFPANGEYYINILGKSITSTELDYNPYIRYRVKVNILNKKKPPIETTDVSTHIRSTSNANRDFIRSLSRKKDKTVKKLSKSASDFDMKMRKKCYDNKDAFLYEPVTHFWRLGHDIRFKTKIKNAKYVCVLDGKRWNYLKKKEEDTFEGNVVIQNANVVICAMRNNNVYTEVFEFYASKH